MGRTYDQWQQDARSRAGDLGVLQELRQEQFPAALEAALGQYSNDHPRHVSRSYAGDGTVFAYDLTDTTPPFDTTTPIVPRWSKIVSVEYPTGQRPPTLLDPSDWNELAGANLGTLQLADGVTPATGETIEITYEAPWPYPTGDPTVDQVIDHHFQPVAALAACRWIEAKITTMARKKNAAIAGDLINLDVDDLREAKRLLEKAYTTAILGRETDDGPTTLGYAETEIEAFPNALFH